MEFHDYSLMKDDYLQIVKFLCVDIFQTLPGKIVLGHLLVLHGLVTIIHVYMFAAGMMNIRDFIALVPTFFTDLFLLGSIFTHFFKIEFVTQIKDEISMWAIETADKRVRDQIKFEIKIIKAVTILGVVVGTLATGLVFLVPLPLDNQFVLAYKLVDEYLSPDWAFLKFIYRLTFPCTFYVIMSVIYATIYCFQHVKIQVTLLCNKIEHLCDFEHNQEYQAEVRKRLVFVSVRHKEILAFGNDKKEQVGFLIGYFSIIGCVMGISIGFFLILYLQVSLENFVAFLRTSLSGCTFSLAFCALIVTGQMLEQELDRIPEVTCLIDWYCFNASNKKIYLIYLIHCMVPWRLSFLSYSINYELGVKIVRGIYTIGSVVINMKSHFKLLSELET